MIYTSEEFTNIYGKIQYRTLYKGDSFDEADKTMRNYKGKNRIEIFGHDGDLLAVKQQIIDRTNEQ